MIKCNKNISITVFKFVYPQMYVTFKKKVIGNCYPFCWRRRWGNQSSIAIEKVTYTFKKKKPYKHIH